MIEIAGTALSARINPLGAELTSLCGADGVERMTDGDPAFWTGHAPLLFPIVGGLNGDQYLLDGQHYPLAKHGFARREAFAVVEQGAEHVRLRLTENERTRAVYPFAFALDADFRIEGASLAMTVTVTNHDARDMPASFGFHPAFAWARAGETIRFEQDEPSPLATLTPEGLIGGTRPSPLDGRMLHLDDSLFTDDALIWPALESGRVDYAGMEVAFPGAPMLGIWTKPGARFVCIEPWWGIADPVGFTGEIWDKPGIQRFAPGQSRAYAMRITIAE